jgi:hypothetical protein
MSHRAASMMRAIGGALRSCYSALSLGLIVGCIMAGAAWAVAVPEEFGGRWALRGGICAPGACKPFYDISQCGEGWCGVEVEEGGKCGQTSMRLAVQELIGDRPYLKGVFRPASGAEPYGIKVYAPTPENGQRLNVYGPRRVQIQGSTSGEFQSFRRTYPLEMSLERVGEPECHGVFQTS